MVSIFKRLVWVACLMVSVQVQAQVAGVGGAAVTAGDLVRLLSPKPATSTGQSATQLPDGRWLLLGGRGRNQAALPDAVMLDVATGKSTALGTGLSRPRNGHSATLMPDGTVLVLGGTDANGTVADSAEQFDPGTATFKTLGNPGLIPRSRHTATVLPDGRLLIAGGVDARGNAIDDIELYNPLTRSSDHINARLDAARIAPLAALLPSGSVLVWGGSDSTHHALDNGEVFDLQTSRSSAVDAGKAAQLAAALTGAEQPAVLESTPAADAANVPVDQRLIVRLSRRMSMASLNAATVTLLGPGGVTAIQPVPVEQGILLFITSQQQLLPGSHYTLFIKGAADENGVALPFTAIGFTTAQLGAQSQPTGASLVTAPNASTAPNQTASALSTSVAQANTATASSSLNAAAVGAMQKAAETPNTDGERWHPDASHFKGDWRARRPASPLQSLPPLAAPTGSTALAGQALTLHGQGLANVTLRIGDQTAQSDETGRFLLKNVSAGTHVLSIDGNTATQRGGQYGFYQVQVNLKDKQTTVLDYTIWLSKLDPAGNLTILSPTSQETVLTSPRIPGLELRIPPGTVIRDHDGKIVTELNMTAIPTDRPPFPIPNVGVPVYFTIQPGASIIQTVNGGKLQGARLIYPNFSGAAPGTRIDFWNYDARGKGWYIYGQGTVTKDGKQVVPDPGVAIYEFTGAMVSLPYNAPSDSPPCNPCSAGDPVDVYTGLFLHENVDLAASDIIPLEVRRSYRPRDPASRAFGIGANLGYDIFIVGDTFPYTYQDLILPDGSRIHYPRTSPGTGSDGAVYTHPPTGSQYDGSTISQAGKSGCFWQLTFRDGAQICFPESIGSSNPRAAAMLSMTDRHGNTMTFTRGSNANLTNVTSPNGRSLQFTYDDNNRITQATDNIGRQSAYQYDSSGRLIKATLPDGSFEAYTYDSNNNMLTVQDQRGNTMVTNVYDSNNRVSKQTYADGATNLFAYTLDANGHATQVDVTSERGIVTRYAFDSTGSPTSVTAAQGQPEQQTTSFERDTNGLLLSRTDALGRKTAYTYNANGNALTETRLAGAPNATTVTMTYTTDFNQLAGITDALGVQTLFSYDAQGHLTQVKDGNGNTTQFSYNTAGLPIQVTDALGKIASRAYDGADLVRVTDPLNRTVNIDTDSVGRAIGMTDPNGNKTALGYDLFNRVSQATDPLGSITTTSFDANGNLAQVKDAKGNIHSYVYDSRNYRTGYTDPLQKSESYAYDGSHNLTSFTDRKGQATQYAYDKLNRLTKVTYTDNSTVSYTYDQGNRVTQIADLVNGTISYAYDGMDRVTSETTPKGAVSYTYYANGLRKSMTVSGQPALRYTYDAGNRLARIDQDAGTVNNNTAQSVVFAYDVANRRTRTTLPNGITLNYSYDDAGQLTSIVYKNADGSQLGDLSYAYDATGLRIKTGGSLARGNLPGDVSNAAVDAANRLTSWNGKALTYDANGNLTNDGVNAYVWNARNQLVQIKDGNGNAIAAFQYDALGRRQSKTVNGVGTGFVYDGANVVQALNGVNADNSQQGNVLASYLTGLGMDELYAAVTGSGSAYQVTSYLTDGLGSTLRLTDKTGAKLVDYTYEPYGAVTADANSGNPFQYTGRENDGTGLYYYRARYYSPDMKRFISEDPMGLKAGINTSAYVAGNPINRTDPLGLWVVAVGVTTGFSSTPVGVNASTGIVFDGSGNFGTYTSYGVGASIGEGGSIGISVAEFGSASNNTTTIKDYAGPFNNTSIGAGVGPYGGVDVFSDPSNPNNFGGGLTVGAGVRGGISHGISQTQVNNIDWKSWIKNWLKPKSQPACK